MTEELQATFQNLLYSEGIDTVFINETWLSASVDNSEILHSEYTLVRRGIADTEFCRKLKQDLKWAREIEHG